MSGISTKNRTIHIRLTKSERALIENKMRSDGYHNLSAWARKRLLSNSLMMEQKVDVVYDYVLKKIEDAKGTEKGKACVAS